MTKIRVRYPDRVRYDREHLGLLPISLATATPATGAATQATAPGSASSRSTSSRRSASSGAPTNCWRENQQPVITVSAELEKRDLGSVNRELAGEACRP